MNSCTYHVPQLQFLDSVDHLQVRILDSQDTIVLVNNHDRDIGQSIWGPLIRALDCPRSRSIAVYVVSILEFEYRIKQESRPYRLGEVAALFSSV